MYLIDEYMNGYRQYSYFNDIPGKLSCYMILGQLLKDDIEIRSHARTFDTRSSVLWMGPMRSGKSITADYISAISKKVGLKFVSVDQFNDASLIGSAPFMNNRGKVIESEPGLLETADILHLDEASVLFQKNIHTQNSLNYLQKALNPMNSESSVLRKKTAHGDMIEFNSSVSFWFTTFPPKDLHQHIMNRGLFQRMILYPKNISRAQRREISLKRANSLWSDEPLVQTDKIALEFLNIKRHYESIELGLGSNFFPVLKNKYRSYHEYIERTMPNVYEVAASFIPNLENYLVVFSALNAAMKYNDKITEEDINEAHNLLKVILQNLTTWIENEMVQEYRRSKRDIRTVELLGLFRSYSDKIEKDWIFKSQLMYDYQQQTGLSTGTIHELLSDKNIWIQKKRGRKVLIRPVNN